VFAALADPVRRSILSRLDGQELLVSQIAQLDISLQAVSKHIHVLVRAGLVAQERTGRISRCSLTAGPIFDAAVWLNRYSKYWQAQFDLLAATLGNIDRRVYHFKFAPDWEAGHLADAAGFWTLDRTTITGRSGVILRHIQQPFHPMIVRSDDLELVHQSLRTLEPPNTRKASMRRTPNWGPYNLGT
jgi:DNA-binding transcriptional ArsR family regulator